MPGGPASHAGDTALTIAPGGAGGVSLAIGTVIACGARVRDVSPSPYLITDAETSLAGAPVTNIRGELIVPVPEISASC